MANEVERKMVAGLRHTYSSSDHDFFTEIDKLGGWPVGFGFVGFVHSEKREAGFTNSPKNDGWWTVIASSDDYYLWKLSPNALQRIVERVICAASITKPDAARITFRKTFGGIAATGTTNKPVDTAEG